MPASGERTPTLRLRELGLELPEPPRPLGRYQAAVSIPLVVESVQSYLQVQVWVAIPPSESLLLVELPALVSP